MARIRNPRYAPEMLESRLSPSGFFYTSVESPTVEVQSTSDSTITTSRTATEFPLPDDSEGDPIPDPTGDPEPSPPGPA